MSTSDIQKAEEEFARKYGKAMGGGAPGGHLGVARGGMRGGMGGGRPMNSVLAKRLQGGGQQWFDSGDYNMTNGQKGPGGVGPTGAPVPIKPPIYNQPGNQPGSPGAVPFKRPSIPNNQLIQDKNTTASNANGVGATSPKSKLAN